ncbi:MAG TPA: hypothetical protein VFL65_00925 [Jatrophihabitans sp.]|nr:hypothetical protein [Jatrophihabitans sp.]
MSARLMPTHCRDCGRPVRTPAEPAPPGVALYGTRGRCEACRTRARRHAIQQPGQPRRPAMPRDVLADELAMLRSAGVDDLAERARRLGMRPLTLRRAAPLSVYAPPNAPPPNLEGPARHARPTPRRTRRAPRPT